MLANLFPRNSGAAELIRYDNGAYAHLSIPFLDFFVGGFGYETR